MNPEAEPPRNVAAGILLIGGIGASALAGRALQSLGKMPSHPLLFYAVFASTLCLCYAAGRLAPAAPPRVPAATPSPLGRAARAAILALACLCLFLYLRYWQVRPAPRIAIGTIAIWASSLAAGIAAFAVGSNGRATAGNGGVRIAWPYWLLLPVLLTAAAVRIIGLDRVPPTFAGDEASQVIDGRVLLHADAALDPLGNGWGGAPHLGMLPAELGSTSAWGPVAGPRLPYAIAGTVSVVGAAATAAILGGGWGALGCAALLAFAPHHVHFSRIASVMILDSFYAPLTVLCLLIARRKGSPLAGYLAGLAAGLSLYGYFEGRVMALVFLLTFPVVVLRAPGSRRDRALLALAGLTGFILAAAPNLRFAAQHWNDWNARVNQTGIFAHDWWNASVRNLGSPAGVLWNQFVGSTLGFLSMYSDWSWYTGFPIVSPILLPAMALAGLGWMVGRRQFFAATVLALVAAGNLAGNMLSQGAPAPQRISSLLPMLAIFGGVAFAGVIGSISPRRLGRFTLRGIAGTLLVGGFLAWSGRPIGMWDPSPGYGGAPAALVTSSYPLLSAPRYRGAAIYLHGGVELDPAFPVIQYLIPAIHWTNFPTEPADADGLPPGLHLFSPYFVTTGRRWKERLQIPFAVEFGNRGEPLRDVGYLLLVPERASARVSHGGEDRPSSAAEVPPRDALTTEQRKALEGMRRAMETMTPEQRAAILELLENPPPAK
jgi:hypothetical protein